MISTTDSAPFDYVDEDGASVIALRRRKREDVVLEHTKNKLARLIPDLTSSLDQPLSSSDHLFEENHPNQYEIRQIQQQIMIEMPVTQPVSKQKPSYGIEKLSL